MIFEDVLEDVMKEPKQVKQKIGTTRYPRVLKTDSGFICYQHKEQIIVNENINADHYKGK